MFKWLKKVWNALTSTKQAPQRRLNLRRYLAGDVPGVWASDHLEETTRCTGYSYVAVRSLALQFAQCELKTNNPAIARLMERPNPNQSGAVFLFAVGQQLAITGTAFVWIVRNGFGVPVEMYCLPTGLTRSQGPSANYPYGSYRVDPLNNYGSTGGTSIDGWEASTPSQALLCTGAEIDAQEVRAIRWPHPIYMNEGLSAFSAGSVMLDIADQVGKARFYALKNYATPGLTIKLSDNVLPDEIVQLEAEIADRNSSPQNAKRNLILPPGVEAETNNGVTELEYLQSHGQSREDVLALHQTPPVAVGITEAGSYAAFYASMLQYIELVVQPSLDLVAGELSHALESPIEMHARRIDDPSVKSAEMDRHISAGAITINEYRKMNGWEPVPWGDVPVGTKPTSTSTPPQPNQPSQSTTGVSDPTREGMPDATTG